MAEGGQEHATTEPQAEAQETCRVVHALRGGKIQMQEAAVKPPGEGEVRVKVEACGVTAADWQVRHGQLKLSTPPFVPGFQCAGTVDAVGDNVQSLEVGQRVVVVHSLSCWVERLVVPATDAYAIPESLTFQQAAGLAFDYITAYLTLHRHANLQKGQSVLIHRAGGGIGFAATQLAKNVPEVVVFGIAPEPQHDVVKENGVDHPIDVRVPDYDRIVRETATDGVEVVVESAAGKDLKKGLNLLKPLGTLVMYGSASSAGGGLFSAAKQKLGPATKFEGSTLIDGNKSVAGVNVVPLIGTDLSREIIKELLSLCEQGKLKPRVDSVFSFRNVADAQKKVHDGANVGAVILVPVIEEEEKAVQDAKQKAEAEKAEKAARKSVRKNKGGSTSSKSDGEAKAENEEKGGDEEKPNSDEKPSEDKPTDDGKADGDSKPEEAASGEADSKPAETTAGETDKEKVGKPAEVKTEDGEAKQEDGEAKADETAA